MSESSECSTDYASIFEKLPGRQKECQILLDLLADGTHLPSSIYIHGNNATGKTATIKLILESINLAWAHLNCVEFDTPALLASQIGAKFNEVYLNQTQLTKCTSLMELLEQMQAAAATKSDPFVIVLDRAERLRDMPSTVIPALLKLREMSSMNVCVVLISDVLWDRYYHGKMRFCKPTISLFFPQYSKQECLDVICKKKPEAVDEAFYKSFASILLRVMYRFCRDVNELMYMADQHFVLVKNLPNDQRSIWNTLQPHLRASTQKVHLRQGIQSNQSDLMSPSVTIKDANLLISAVTAMELPYYAKFLLMAAFLASFNLPKYDRRLFAKHHGMQKKRAAAGRKTVKRSSLIVGPKAFNFERLTAIFHSIADTPYLITTNLCAQLATLVNLNLITKVGYSGLNDPKYRCAIGLELIKAVGKTVDFNVQSYIMEEF